jgi:hypothetical protein
MVAAVADARNIDSPIGNKCSADGRVAVLARRQHGVVAHRQLLRIGLTGRAIYERRRAGRLHDLHRGVYAVGHLALTREGRWMAAVLAGGPGAVLSHRTAAALWGVHQQSAGPIDVTVGDRRRPRPGLRFHRSALPRDEVTVRNGISVTTVPRTLLDLASVLARDRLERAVHEADVLRLADPLSVPQIMARHHRCPGTAALRSALGTRPQITRSELEHSFLHLLTRHEIDPPRTNALITVAGDRTFEVDCLWKRRRLIIELDGRAVHDTAQAFERDRERDRLLTLAGWRVARFTWRHVAERPAEVAAHTRALLALAA